ncbi:MAG: ABC transporter ATP-binding protein [Bacteroidetes bacterium]|nr:MAG: ABC transporter ATP-binding protein [Bacteroidota bacterium]
MECPAIFFISPDPSEASKLILSGLCKSYRDVQAIHASLEIKPGYIHGLLGANGAGKSTLIKLIMGLTLADEGEMKGIDPRRLSYLPEHPHLPLDLSASQIIRFVCSNRGQSPASSETLLDEVGLDPDHRSKKIRGFSKGMRQRVALAYCLAGEPEWLILDEPMSGLDVLGRKLVLDILRQRKGAGMGVLMSSHIVTDMVRVCDYIHIMARGEIRESIEVTDHSIDTAEYFESRMMHWNMTC